MLWNLDCSLVGQKSQALNQHCSEEEGKAAPGWSTEHSEHTAS